MNEKIELGDRVVISDRSPFGDAGVTGIFVVRHNENNRTATIFREPQKSPSGKPKDGYTWVVNYDELDLVSKYEGSFSETEFCRKSEFLEVINQDKSAEEILLDIKDHLTN